MYSKDDPVHGFYHNDIYIKSQLVGNHLGHCIGPKLDNKDVKHVSNNFCVAFNLLMSAFGNLNCQLNTGYLKLTVCHFMVQYCGIYPTRVLNIFALNGGKVYVNFLICHTQHTVIF